MRAIVFIAIDWAALLALLAHTNDLALGLLLAGLCWPLATASGVVVADLVHRPGLRAEAGPREAAHVAAAAYAHGDRRPFQQAEATFRGEDLETFATEYYRLLPAPVIRLPRRATAQARLGAIAKAGGRL